MMAGWWLPRVALLLSLCSFGSLLVVAVVLCCDDPADSDQRAFYRLAELTCNRHLIEKYDKSQKLLGGPDEQSRNRVRMFIHAAEGTFMAHCLAITYARWFCPESVRESGGLLELERGLAVNVCRDLDWLEGELEGGRFLGGESELVLLSLDFGLDDEEDGLPAFILIKSG